MTTATDTSDLLRLSQWLSPAFPVSSYAYSHGLEAEIAQGRVRSAADVQAWVETVLQAGSGQSDAILMLAARNGGDAEELGDLARALAASKERRQETEDQGRALAETLSALDIDVEVAPFPVVLGVAARTLALPDQVVASLYLQAFAGMLVSAAVRFVPLGQVEGQKILQSLHLTVTAVAERATQMTLEDIGQSSFGADLAAMEHETLEVRIFRT